MTARILFPSEMTSCDNATIKEENITGYALMRRAATSAYHYAINAELIQKNDNIAVIAGLGNNAGDGVVMAESLRRDGYDVTLYLLGEPFKRSSALNQAIEDYRAAATYHEITDETTLKQLKEIFKDHTLFIDALFGTGLTKPLKGLFKLAVNMVNTTKKPILSIDVPSGINAYNGIALNDAFKADHTLVIQTYKTGNLINDAPDYHGTIHIVDAGIKTLDFEQTRRLGPVRPDLPKRKLNTHKYNHGSLLFIGGAHGMEGAPILSASGAMRAGAGMATVLFDPTASVHKPVPLEVLSLTMHDVSEIKSHLARKDAIVFGMGLGRNTPEYADVLRMLIKESLPILVDADGLHYLKALLEEPLDFSNVLITPHLGECARLLSKKTQEIKRDPFAALDELCDKGLAVVLKGPCTIVAEKHRRVFHNYPNAALAKAGSGDVLSGLIGAFMPHMNRFEAAQTGCILQGLTARECKRIYPEESFLPTDLIKHLPDTIKMLK